MLGFASNTVETFVIGASFLSGNYYAIFDDTNSKLTLAPQIGASFATIDMGTVTFRTLSVWDNPNVNAPVFSIMGITMIGGVIVAILTKMGIIDMLIANSGTGAIKNAVDVTSSVVDAISNVATSSTNASRSNSTKGSAGKANVGDIG